MTQLNQRPSIEDFELLAEVSQMLTVLDQDRVLERVIELMAKAVDASKVSLILHPEYLEDWRQIFVKPLTADAEVEPSQPQPLHLAQRVLDKGLAGWVFRHK